MRYNDIYSKKAKNINLSFFENLKKEEIVKNLIIFYEEDDYMEIFNYKHNFIDYTDQYKDMVTIHGLEQNCERNYEWRSITMRSNNSYTHKSSSGDGHTVWRLNE
jgi:hypothetical protein